MNKILVDGEKYILEENTISIEVNGNTKLYINDICNYDLRITLNDNSTISVFDFSKSNNVSKMSIIQNNNTKFHYYHSFIITDNYNREIVATINGDNNLNDINITGISKGMAAITVDGIINPKTKNNIVNENIKVLTDNGKVYVSPMLHVSTENVCANHNTAITKINEQELFYLMSKGIDKTYAIKLIENGYIYNVFKNEEDFLMIIK